MCFLLGKVLLSSGKVSDRRSAALVCPSSTHSLKHASSLSVCVYVLRVAITVVVSLALDRLYYGRFTVVLWNFIRFNVLGAGGSFYGTHPLHWYVSNALPQMIGPLLPLALLGSYTSNSELGVLLCLAVAWPTAVYSCFSHKELRLVIFCSLCCV
jgi:Alg9-like mannosyltransferase family